MISLLGGIALLVIGYFTYGKFIEKNFQIAPDRKTPAEVLKDGMDFVPMSRSKNAIIQLLNIAILVQLWERSTGQSLMYGLLSAVSSGEPFTIT